MRKSDKILHSTEDFQLIERDGNVGLKSMSMEVIVMPFTCDSEKLPLLIGVIYEKNPFRSGGELDVSLISGIADNEDPDLLSTARRALLDSSGVSIEDTDKWYYLGTSTSSKFVDNEYPCFAVDITDMEGEIKNEGDFKFIPANDVIKTRDIFIPGLFLKLFKYVMGMNISNPSEKSKLEKNNDRHNLTL